MFGRYAGFAVGLFGLLFMASMALAQTQLAPGTPVRLALKGYDSVAYFTDGKPIPGRPEFETIFDEARYRFASAQHLEQFKADPDRFAPQYAGSCAGSMAAGIKIEAEPENWLIVDGKLFVFAGPAGVGKMRANSTEMIAKGQENWRALASAPFPAKR